MLPLMYETVHLSTRYSRQILMKLNTDFRKIFNCQSSWKSVHCGPNCSMRI